MGGRAPGMQGEHQPIVRQEDHFPEEPRGTAGGGEGQGQVEPSAVFEKLPDCRKIMQRLAHAGKGQALGLDPQGARPFDLRPKFGDTEIAQQSPRARGAKGAADGATRLTGETEGAAAVMDGLDGETI